MEGERFDELLRGAFSGVERRGVVRAGIGALAGAVLTAVGLGRAEESEAKKKKKHKKKKKPSPPVSPPPSPPSPPSPPVSPPPPPVCKHAQESCSSGMCCAGLTCGENFCSDAGPDCCGSLGASCSETCDCCGLASRCGVGGTCECNPGACDEHCPCPTGFMCDGGSCVCDSGGSCGGIGTSCATVCDCCNLAATCSDAGVCACIPGLCDGDCSCASGQSCQDGQCVCDSGIDCGGDCCQIGSEVCKEDFDNPPVCQAGTCPETDYCTDPNLYTCNEGCSCATSINGVKVCSDFEGVEDCVDCTSDAQCGPGKVCIPQDDTFCSDCTGNTGICIPSTCTPSAGLSAAASGQTPAIFASKLQASQGGKKQAHQGGKRQTQHSGKRQAHHRNHRHHSRSTRRSAKHKGHRHR